MVSYHFEHGAGVRGQLLHGPVGMTENNAGACQTVVRDLKLSGAVGLYIRKVMDEAISSTDGHFEPDLRVRTLPIPDEVLRVTQALLQATEDILFSLMPKNGPTKDETQRHVIDESF